MAIWSSPMCASLILLSCFAFRSSESASDCSATPSYPSSQSYVSQAIPSSSPSICGPVSSHPYTLSSSSTFSTSRISTPEVTPLTITIQVSSTYKCSPLANAKVSIWHARPDGRYGPLGLSPDNDDGVGQCRGMFPSDSHGTVTVDTFVPGTYGILNGLGPGGFDLPPYGPKVVHFHVQAEGYKTLVTQAVVPEDGEKMADWRGTAIVLGVGGEELKSTGKDISKLKIRLVLEPSEDGHRENMCPSGIFWGFPYSFFTESIAECKPALLRYFEL